MFCKQIAVLAFLCLGTTLVTESVLDSDLNRENLCTDTFRYVNDAAGYVTGEVTIPVNGLKDIVVTVNATVAGVLDKKTKLLINLKSNPQDLIYNPKGKAVYDVLFPTQNPLPEVTQISLNGQILCLSDTIPSLKPGESLTYMSSSHRVTIS
ncbi:uncharacterized protein LOC115879305 [Sitophilus oryzae]|uniref:Uncharacterized protein LOC115879305 n=1 Tax=Sitophilus oryzae TaxID=7048 RepID=A0A6J2XM09_SITOR|nr:uncharacterized protein LOC115879305 [Sitophilus oryzae]